MSVDIAIMLPEVIEVFTVMWGVGVPEKGWVSPIRSSGRF